MARNLKKVNERKYRLWVQVNMDPSSEKTYEDLSAREAILLMNAIADEQLDNPMIEMNVFDIQEWDEAMVEEYGTGWTTAYADNGEEISRLTLVELAELAKAGDL